MATDLQRSAEDAADRLGLGLTPTDEGPILSRRGVQVALAPLDCIGPADAPTTRFALAWTLLGIRLGLDKLVAPAEPEPTSTPLHFRRTKVRRYHEAPSVHGDHLPLLVPPATRQCFEIIAATEAFSRCWGPANLEVLIVHQTGRKWDILTAKEQAQSTLSDSQRWEKVRSALFYQSYKLRPTRSEDFTGGRLRLFETTEGFGASRAILLPEYDYDAAREMGYFAVPSRDQIVIARPDSADEAPQLKAPLRDWITQCQATADFGLTDAIFGLSADEVLPGPSNPMIPAPAAAMAELIGPIER